MWRTWRNPAGRRVNVPSVIAILFALAVLGAMVWVAMTGNYFCCDPRSLVGQLRQHLFTGPRPDRAVVRRQATPRCPARRIEELGADETRRTAES